MTESQLPYIDVERLREGMYVCLELGWMDHPFTFSSFKIQSAEQIATIRSLGLKRVRHDPARSNVPPEVSPGTASPSEAKAALDPMATRREARAATRQRVREAIATGERELAKAATMVRGISHNIIHNPAKTVADADKLVTLLVDRLLNDQEVAIQLMNDKVAGEEVYYHSLNVSILSMLLARAMQLEGEHVRNIGIGALFHDIGLVDVPDRVKMKKEARNKAEEGVYRQHCGFGVDIARRAGLPPEVIAIVGLHHEAMDGSGYPKGLAGEAIPLPVRVVSSVDHYDELCNPLDLARALTPHEALSMMYAKQRNRHDHQVLATLIKSLGVFPPGTVVKLSNDMIGLVVSVDERHPLRPAVAVYDPTVPKDEAPILELAQDASISVSKALRPAVLPKEILDYLNPRKRVTYFFDSKSAAGKDKR